MVNSNVPSSFVVMFFSSCKLCSSLFTVSTPALPPNSFSFSSQSKTLATSLLLYAYIFDIYFPVVDSVYGVSIFPFITPYGLCIVNLYILVVFLSSAITFISIIVSCWPNLFNVISWVRSSISFSSYIIVVPSLS